MDITYKGNIVNKSITTLNSIPELETYLKNNNYVLLSFGATWCNPCKLFTPKLEEISLDERFKSVKFLKCDISLLNDTLQKQYKIFAVPIFVFIKNGVEVTRVNGANYAEIVNMLIRNI